MDILSHESYGMYANSIGFLDRRGLSCNERYHFTEVMEQCTCPKSEVLIPIVPTRVIARSHEATLDEMKMYGTMPRHEDEVPCQEDLVPFELRWR